MYPRIEYPRMILCDFCQDQDHPKISDSGMSQDDPAGDLDILG